MKSKKPVYKDSSMMKQEISFMEKKKAPKAMLKHEKAEYKANSKKK